MGGELAQKKKKGSLKSYLKRYWTLYLLLVLPIAFFIIFRYIPMAYIQMAFKDYNFSKSIWEMDWAGLKYFAQAFANRDFWTALRNTVVLNGLDLIVSFPAPILLALLLNELRHRRFKRVTQTVAYMPHFLSWVVIYGLALQLLATSTGFVNNVIDGFGGERINFLGEPGKWIGTYVISGVWQSVGWNTIIYLAAITAINPELYEAAAVDGAGRFRRMWHITLPGIRSTAVVLFIMSVGRIVGGEMDRPFAMRNLLVKDVADTIAIFVYLHGPRSMQFELATAVGLFQSVVCVIFLFAANALAKRFGEAGVW